ncbi:MAG TPA: ABC transporter family substrate-binding protein [Acidimicrobiales bacterium]|nr:ABC transporter family substrate-binding protein [Acidimicrobiales bacterium]
MRGRRVLVPAVIAVAAIGGACGSTRGDTSSRPRSAGSAPALVGAEGGTATVDVDAIPTTLNANTVAGQNAVTEMVAAAVWPQVFEVDPKVTPTLNTAVVTSAEVVSVDPQTVVYQIDPCAVWSDGVPISADDFVYAWTMQRGGAVDLDGSPASVASTTGYRDIASVTGSNGGTTVTVVFRTSFADWPSLFNNLVPAHIAESVGWNHGFDRFDPSVVVSGGPWEVASWIPGTEMELVKNPHWWGRPAHLDKIVLHVAAQVDSSAADLTGGEAQVAAPAGYDPTFLATVSSSPTLTSQSSLGTVMLQLEFNVTRSPFSSTDVRLGIAQSIDRLGIVTSVAQPLDPMVGPDDNHLFANVQGAYADDATGDGSIDVEAARSLFAQAGLVADQRGTWTRQGSPVMVHLAWASDDPLSAAVGPIIAAELVSAGFDVATQPVSSTQLVSTVLPTGAFDLALAPVPAGAYPTAMARYFSTMDGPVRTGASFDWSGFDDPKVDALFAQAAQDLAGQSAQSLYQQIDQELWLELPTLPLFAEPMIVTSAVDLLGPQPDPGGSGVLWNADQWFDLVPASPARALGARITSSTR